MRSPGAERYTYTQGRGGGYNAQGETMQNGAEQNFGSCKTKEKTKQTKVNKNKKTNLNDIKEKTPSIMAHIRDERRGDVTLLI
jgi:hypothetical protein